MKSSKVGDKISKGQLPEPAIAPVVQEAIDGGRKTSSEKTIMSPVKQETSINGDVSIDYSPLSINGDASIDYSPLSIQNQEKSEWEFKHQEDDVKKVNSQYSVNRHPNEKVEDNFAMMKGCGGWLDE
nr:uncharacterized protein LOC109180742 [Ipomoea batatas]